MTPEPSQDDRAWDELSELVDSRDLEQIEIFLEALSASEAALALSRLTDGERTVLLTALEPEDAAELMEQLPATQAIDALGSLEPATAAAIVHELPSDEQADVLGELSPEDAEAILAELSEEEASEARSLIQYEDDEAGGLMITEYVSYRERQTVAQVMDDLRAHAEEYRRWDVLYVYVVDRRERLLGVLRLRDLLLAPADTRIGTLVQGEPLSVADTTSLEELQALFDRHGFWGLPVVNADGRLVGLVEHSALEETLAEDASRTYLETQGIVGGEELRTMPLHLRSGRRLSWLSVNVLLNVVAASVIAFYQDTLAAVIALAVFLPIISDMSGCSGNQAVAVSMRELSLGLVKPTEMLWVWGKEVTVGLVNGTALGLLIAAVAWAWQGNGWLGLVVGVALAANTVVAVSIGGTVPLVLRRFGLDPALASGPILTTVTDMCGFFLVLSIAQALMPRLV